MEPLPDPPHGSPRHLPYLQRPIPERIDDVRQAIEAYAEHADLREALAEKNVQPDRIDALAARLAPVLDAVKAIDTAGRAVKKASTAQTTAVAEAERTYGEVADLARAAFRTNPAAHTALGLGEAASRRLDRFAQMHKLYDGAADYERELTDYGVKPAALTVGREALDAAERAVRAADRRDVEAQDATDARDQLFEPLDTLYRDFQERAKTALKGRPQLLELLGLRPQ